jgi:alkylation response protein AidB-like acyl-CoA dehydrogenase
VRQRAREIDEQNRFPRTSWRRWAGWGSSAAYARGVRGTALGYKSYVLAIEQLCTASLTVGAIIAINALTQQCLLRFGTDEQKRATCRRW